METIDKAVLEQAPPFVVLRGYPYSDVEHAYVGEPEPDWYGLFQIETSVAVSNRDDISGLHIESDDEAAPEGFDDLDAALAYLAHGGWIVKVPDEAGSSFYRFFAAVRFDGSIYGIEKASDDASNMAASSELLTELSAAVDESRRHGEIVRVTVSDPKSALSILLARCVEHVEHTEDGMGGYDVWACDDEAPQGMPWRLYLLPPTDS